MDVFEWHIDLFDSFQLRVSVSGNVKYTQLYFQANEYCTTKV